MGRCRHLLLSALALIYCLIVKETDGQIYLYTEGSISSPNFPDYYPNNTFMDWLINAPYNQIIDIRFLKLDLKRKKDQVCVDYVKIFDGTHSGYPLLGTYCGYDLDARTAGIRVRSSGMFLYVQFVSGPGGSGSGFNMTYTSHGRFS
ncbi:embryonic protein UVS.2-like [Physella acuta]|uniref:embryonic protein UVS.2-like n=1 Tax=Physella acuta TaxID=109671 RepID=UPI0027DAEDDF|nr:embryonic protein UVS.2-like [Physella acuta]